MKPSILAVVVLAVSASAFAPSRPVEPTTPTALHATSTRRRILQDAAAAASVLSLLPAPALAATDAATYAASIERSTNTLSQSLGHALLVVDGLNAQARRLGSSPHPAHPVAVLDGMRAQARRLTRDLDRSREVLDEIKSQADDITIADEKYRLVSGDVAHASSVLDGLVAQSKRLEGAASSGGGSAATDDQIIYMLSVLDGLNAQVRRLDMGETFGVLDELNAKAASALL